MQPEFHRFLNRAESALYKVSILKPRKSVLAVNQFLDLWGSLCILAVWPLTFLRTSDL